MSETAIDTTAGKPKSFAAMLETMKPQLAAALPKHLSADRMARIALTCYRNTPKLAECDPTSVIAAVVQCAQLGLEPGLMGQAYLIPFKKSWKVGNQWHSRMECQFMPGYRGLVTLARRGGEITSLNAELVYENDEFELSLGVDQKLTHKPKLEGDRGAIKLVYAVAKFKDGGYHFDWMTMDAVQKIRERNDKKNTRNGEARETPWDTDEAEMIKKTMIRRITKMLPMSVELAQAVAVADAVDMGKHAILDGDFVNVSELPGPSETQGSESTGRPMRLVADDAAFKKLVDSWTKPIQSGNKTSTEALAIIATRYELNEKQIAEIHALTPTTVD